MAVESQRPPVWRSMLEFRAGLEGFCLLASYPLLARVQGGSGPVLLIPGFTTSDNSTWFIRRFLVRLGYDCYGWEQGVNRGMVGATFDKLAGRLRDIHDRDRQPVALVGWNVGGFYARALANRHPELVKQVITLATPFALPSVHGVSQALNRLYRYLNESGASSDIMNDSAAWEETPPVPSSSIYSEGDGVTNWRYCLEQPGLRNENIRIVGSHLGMIVNPAAWFVVADRLAEDPDSWHSFADKHSGQLVLNSFVAADKA
jgi:pimeloyl-ACP methyl ester carboxylesterase